MYPNISTNKTQEAEDPGTKHPTDRAIVQKALDGNSVPLVFFLQNDCIHIFNYIRIDRLRYLDLGPKDLISDFYIFLNKNDWKVLRTCRFEAKLQTWISTVASRFLLQKYSKELKESAQLNPLVCETTLQDTMFSEKKLTQFELEDAIGKLANKRDRQILRYTLKDYSTEEIALEMEVSISNVYVLRNRAIRNLKRLLDEGK